MRASKYVSLLLLALLMLASCFSAWQGGATIIINLGGAEGRAVWPPAGDMFERMAHTVELSGPTGVETHTLGKGELTFSAEVAPGKWTVRVNAFLDNKPYAIGVGEAEVKAGQNAIEILMEQVIWYTVTFDTNNGSDVTTVDVVKGELLPRPADPYKAGLYMGEEVSPSSFDNWYKDSDLTSAWDFAVDKVTADTSLYAKWGGLVPIDLSAYTGSTIIDSAVQYANMNPGTYTLFIGAETYDTDALILNTGFKLTIEGLGGESVVDWDSEGSVFTLEGSGTELKLGNYITLQGNDGNNAPLVTVQNGAKLVLNTGSKITGNTFNVTATETGGAGILVDNAELLIAGGEVSDNIAQGNVQSIRGGGVFATNGSRVIMTGGTVKNNNIKNIGYNWDTDSFGSGICISGRITDTTVSGSVLEIWDGIIEGNSQYTESSGGGAWTRGGGVAGHWAEIYFKGGTIRNNICEAFSANDYGGAFGGGICNYGHIQKLVVSGGIINGNKVISSISNKGYGPNEMYMDGAYGGGVSTDGTLSFEKTGGVIYGHEATGSDDANIPLANTAQSEDNGFGGGHAVFVDTGLGKAEKLYRNSSSLAGDNMNSSVSGVEGGWEPYPSP